MKIMFLGVIIESIVLNDSYCLGYLFFLPFMKIINN